MTGQPGQPGQPGLTRCTVCAGETFDRLQPYIGTYRNSKVTLSRTGDRRERSVDPPLATYVLMCRTCGYLHWFGIPR